MAKAEFNLDRFRSQIFNQSLARNNRFEVFINPPAGLSEYGPVVSLLVEQASLPMLNVATKPFKIFGPTYQRPYSIEYGGEGIALTFHVDRDMKVKKFFDDWVHYIINPDTFATNYQNNYIGTVEIRQLDEQENVTYAVRLNEAFPRNLNLMDLNNSASNQTHRLNVLFAYRYWEPANNENRTSPVDIPRNVTTPQIPTFDARLLDTRRQWNWSTGTLDDVPGSDLPPAA